MPNQSMYANRFVTSGLTKLKLNLRAYGKICDAKQTHADVAEIDPESVHVKRLRKDLYGSVHHLAWPAAPIFEVSFEHPRLMKK